MARKLFALERIIIDLREPEVGLAQEPRVRQMCKRTGVTEQTATGGGRS